MITFKYRLWRKLLTCYEFKYPPGIKDGERGRRPNSCNENLLKTNFYHFFFLCVHRTSGRLWFTVIFLKNKQNRNWGFLLLLFSLFFFVVLNRSIFRLYLHCWLNRLVSFDLAFGHHVLRFYIRVNLNSWVFYVHLPTVTRETFAPTSTSIFQELRRLGSLSGRNGTVSDSHREEVSDFDSQRPDLLWSYQLSSHWYDFYPPNSLLYVCHNSVWRDSEESERVGGPRAVVPCLGRCTVTPSQVTPPDWEDSGFWSSTTVGPKTFYFRVGLVGCHS